MDSFFWAIIAALIWGVCPILEKFGLSGAEPLPALFYRCFGVVIGIILMALFYIKPYHIKSVGLKSAAFLIISGFLASFVAQIAFYHGLKTGEVSRVVPISGSYPLIAFILGLFILGETLTPIKLIGVVLITGGIWALKIG